MPELPPRSSASPVVAFRPLAATTPLVAVPPRKATPMPLPVQGPFAKTRFRFTSGIPAGETAEVRDDDGNVILNYRSFASVIGIVAALVSGIVLVAGIAAATFLILETRMLPGAIVLLLCAAFAVLIAMVVPATNVTIYDGAAPVLTIVQQSSLSIPVVTYFVATNDGKPLARVRRSVFSRLGRNRWGILPISDDHAIGEASEESLAAALIRKLLGKFDPRYQSNLRIRYLDADAGTIARRPDAAGLRDVLDLHPDTPLDHRVAVALATLVLGSEP